MKNTTAKCLLGFLTALVFANCGSVATVGNPRGAQVNVALTNDIDNPSSSVSRVTISAGSYTPDIYTVGLRYLSLVRCTDSAGDDIVCPGERGEEVENNLDAGEAMAEASLNDSVFADHVLYASGSGGYDTSIGSAGDIATDPVEEAGIYSAVRLGIDFVMTAFPGAESSVDIPSAADGFEFALLCLNEDGCSALSGYSASYLGGLGDGAVEFGDVVFLNSAAGDWYWWDVDAGEFVALSDGRPVNPLEQTGVLADLVHGDDGEFAYSASFGSDEGGLDALDITQDLIDAGAIDTLTTIFSVEGSMSFDDDNGNDVIDTDEMASFAFGKPRITTFEVADETF